MLEKQKLLHKMCVNIIESAYIFHPHSRILLGNQQFYFNYLKTSSFFEYYICVDLFFLKQIEIMTKY